MVFCAPIAFQVGNSRKVFQVMWFLVFAGTAVSAFGYLRREQREDWRGVTEYLLKLPEKQRLSVIVPDIGQALVQHYASGIYKSYPPIQMTGLLTGFDPQDLSFEDRILHLQDDPDVDPLAILSTATALGRYKEIDVVMQPGTSPFLVTPTLQYLATHCGSVEMVAFHWLEVRRCFIQSTMGNYNP